MNNHSVSANSLFCAIQYCHLGKDPGLEGNLPVIVFDGGRGFLHMLLADFDDFLCKVGWSRKWIFLLTRKSTFFRK
jgi:hypothetical protein